MSYATRSDMELRFGAQEIQQLSDLAVPRLGATNDAVLTRALDDASAFIDGYLIGRYATPITDARALPLLRMHCCNVARFILMTTNADDAATKAYEAAVSYFKDVGRGNVNLLPPDAAAEPQGAGTVEFDMGSKVMGRESSWRDC